MKVITKILKELIISTNRIDRMYAITYLKELGRLGVRAYRITKKEKHLDILKDLAKTIKFYDDKERSLHKDVV